MLYQLHILTIMYYLRQELASPQLQKERNNVLRDTEHLSGEAVVTHKRPSRAADDTLFSHRVCK